MFKPFSHVLQNAIDQILEDLRHESWKIDHLVHIPETNCIAHAFGVETTHVHGVVAHDFVKVDRLMSASDLFEKMESHTRVAL
jgi:hypothetical protein